MSANNPASQALSRVSRLLVCALTLVPLLLFPFRASAQACQSQEIAAVGDWTVFSDGPYDGWVLSRSDPAQSLSWQAWNGVAGGSSVIGSGTVTSTPAVMPSGTVEVMVGDIGDNFLLGSLCPGEEATPTPTNTPIPPTATPEGCWYYVGVGEEWQTKYNASTFGGWQLSASNALQDIQWVGYASDHTTVVDSGTVEYLSPIIMTAGVYWLDVRDLEVIEINVAICPPVTPTATPTATATNTPELATFTPIPATATPTTDQYLADIRTASNYSANIITYAAVLVVGLLTLMYLRNR